MDPDEVNDKPVEEKGAEKKPQIDPNKPLSTQVSKLLDAVPEGDEEGEQEESKEVEESAEEEADTGTEEQSEEESEEEPDEGDDSDDVEEKELEPLPAWQQYIIDNLPEIRVMGHQGDGSDKEFKVKRIEELPDDFEFASKRAELAFNAAIASQEVNARELLAKYRQEEANRAQKEFESLEAVDIQNDIKVLQKAGVLPKFKYAESDPKFNDDEAVKEANKIYEFYKKVNSEYYTKYQGSGRMYRVSYEDAAYRYYALHPKEAPKDLLPKSQTQEKREKVAAKVGAPQGASSDSKPRPLPRGTSINDVYKLYKNGNI